MNLSFTVNTAKAILHAAQTFKHPQHVIWEYVVNEIQYRDKKIAPKILVRIEKDSIVISGNGNGMDKNDLKRFFTLHGENEERLKGNPGRGKFGTGKSAVFAIAKIFTITTCKNNKEFKLRINYTDLKKNAKSGDAISLEKFIISDGIKVNKPNGTIIEISDFFNGIKINDKEIRVFLEKHLKYYTGAEVWINNHRCEFREPENREEIFKFNSFENNFNKIGNVNLIIKIALEPLEKHDNGISILSNNNLHEITLAGSEGREMANHIFGEIDCPLLDDDTAEISSYSMSRDMTLNGQSPVVRELYNFIGLKIEQVRKQLVEQQKEKRKSEEAKKLQKVADNISQIINKHFKDYIDKIKTDSIKKSDGSFYSMPSSSGKNKDNNETLTLGDQLSALLEINNNRKEFEEKDDPEDKKNDKKSKNLNENNDRNVAALVNDKKNEKKSKKINDEVLWNHPGNVLDKKNYKKSKRKNVKSDDNDEKKAKKINSDGNDNSSGGTKFKVIYDNHGINNARAKFVVEENTVFINLDHPYISSLDKDKESEMFQKVTYEVAFTEYAMGLVRLLYNNKYFKDNTDEYLQEVRSIVNALSIAK
jgi:hypothetical protein